MFCCEAQETVPVALPPRMAASSPRPSSSRGVTDAPPSPPSHSSPSYSPPDSPSPARRLSSSIQPAAYPSHVPSPRFGGDFVGLALWSEGDQSRPITPRGEDWVGRPTRPSPPRFGGGHSPCESDQERGHNDHNDTDFGDDEDDEDDPGEGQPNTPLSSSSVDLDAAEADIFSVHLKPRDRLSSSSTSSSRRSYARPKEKYDLDPLSPRQSGQRGVSDAEIPLLPVSTSSMPPFKDEVAADIRARRRRQCLTYTVVFVVLFGIATGLARAVKEHRRQWGSDGGFRGVDLAAVQVDGEEESWSTGGNGDVVTTETGETFVYVNHL